MAGSRLHRLVGAIGVSIAISIAVFAPAGYLAVRVAAEDEALRFKAELSATRAARFIFVHEGVWQYQHVRLGEVIEYPGPGGTQLRQSILDLSGRPVMQERTPLAAPLHSVRLPILVGGAPVAWLEAQTSLRPALHGTLYVVLASGVVGLLAWLTVRLLPLRALDHTLRQLSTQSARFMAALDNMTQGLCMFDAGGRLVVHNRRFTEMFGTPQPGTSAEELAGGSGMHAAGLGVLFAPVPHRDGADGGTHELPDGRVIQVSSQALPDGGWVATYEDVTERRRSQQRLSHMARHDALTGLSNRLMLREHMEGALSRLTAGGALAVLGLDLDGFKAVNDMFGHSAGDDLLRGVARRLRDTAREGDLVARMGGDEFTILQADVSQPRDVMAFAERLVAALRAPFEIMGQPVGIGVSIGIALAEGPGHAVEELLRNADTALYRAKASGRGTYCFFEPGMDAQIQRRRRLEAELRLALSEEQFELHYQPLIEAHDGRLAGFEALVRWRHPTRGLVPPGEFIPVAEEIGLIRPLGAWVLATACHEAMNWRQPLRVAVNLSPLQFASGNLVHQVERALDASGLPASRLELEVTESVMLQNSDTTLDVLRRLHALGVRIAMDDFGTGYSSLSYLRCFPFDKIKIDRSFVQSLPAEQGSIEIIRAVVGLGKALGMDVLAEGVETEAQRAMLREEGCTELQGYLFSRPIPAQEVEPFLARAELLPGAVTQEG